VITSMFFHGGKCFAPRGLRDGLARRSVGALQRDFRVEISINVQMSSASLAVKILARASLLFSGFSE